MKNYEFYEDKIKAITESGYSVTISNNEPVACGDILCSQCDFDCSGVGRDGISCQSELINWLYKEYVELTEEEHALCVALNKGYIARGRKGSLVIFTDKPVKNEELGTWITNGVHTRFFNHFPHLKFDFIKWEDDEPYSFMQLIKAPVKKSESEEEQHE